MSKEPHGESRTRLDERAIAAILTAALLAGRLAPGLRLGEQQLAALFEVSRERIRKVLHQLGHQRLIELHANRGAFVAEPGLREARQVYQARRILESGVALHLSTTITQGQLAAMEALLTEERAANDAHDHAEAVRLSGLFHSRLAELTGNEFVIRQMHELVGRTAMLVAYHETDSPHCGCDEHGAILAAIGDRDAGRAAREMQLHLSLIETRLQEPPVRAATVDVEDVLREEIARWIALQDTKAPDMEERQARRERA